MLDLKPLLFLLLHEELFAIKLLLQLFDLDVQRLLFFLGPLELLLIDLVVQKDVRVQILHVLMHRFVALREILVFVVQQAYLVLKLTDLLICIVRVGISCEHFVHEGLIDLQSRRQIFDLLQ